MENLKSILFGEQAGIEKLLTEDETLQNSFQNAEPENNNHSSTSKPLVQF